MKNYLLWASFGCLSLLITLTSHAADTKSVLLSGHFVGGYTNSWVAGGAKGSQWLVDDLALKMNFDVTDKIKVVVENNASITPGTTALSGGGTVHNSSAFYSQKAALTAGGFTFANTSAYINHRCGDHLNYTLGHFVTPFGMENMWGRPDMHSYHYSYGYKNAQTYGWNHDLGVQINLIDLGGNWEVAVIDGRNFGNVEYTPAALLRWSMNFAFGGEGSLMPVASTYLGRWQGGPEDLGFTVGMGFKMSIFWLNAEWVYNSYNTDVTTDTAKTKTMSVWGEPGVDLGVVKLSTKLDFKSYKLNDATASVTDFDIAAAIGHDFSGKTNVKAIYAHNNLKGDLPGGHSNDFRVLVSTKW